ncbi:MAG: alpha/beta hydrolase [Xanthobacteraceae bacterium]|nr:MAG: alpha/beta hydrolase [Xanthobacteraceae bacterium]
MAGEGLAVTNDIGMRMSGRTPMNYRVAAMACSVAVSFLAAAPVDAQVSALPPETQQVIDAVGPAWATNLPANINRIIDSFRPLLGAAQKDGVQITKGIGYGSNPKQILDVYQPVGRTGVPVVIYIHGGAYVRGDKDAFGVMYGNIPTWFARQGLLGINATYRLAPAAPWPAGAEDVGGMVRWAKENALKYGGDPNRVYLIGHSAGATHAATYIFDKTRQPTDGPGVAGAVLMSGRYWLEFDPKDPNGANMQAYFGKDPAEYPNRSPITHIATSKVPVFIVISEYENPGLDVSGAKLLSALCARDGKCPRFMRLSHHNHVSEVAAFNTADVELGQAILEFIERGR